MQDSLLVTGGAGFIGSCFVRDWLAGSPGRVVNLDKLTYAGCLDSLADARTDARHVFVQGDICSGDLVRDLLAQHRPRAIVHFAAESHVDRSIDGPDAFLQTNINGTHELLKAALIYWRSLAGEEHERFRFLYVNTDEIYGSAGPVEFFTEQTTIKPNSPIRRPRRRRGIWSGRINIPTGCRR